MFDGSLFVGTVASMWWCLLQIDEGHFNSGSLLSIFRSRVFVLQELVHKKPCILFQNGPKQTFSNSNLETAVL